MPKGDRDILKADPEDGTTPIANLLLEALAIAKLTGKEKGAVLHLWRQTYGWQINGKRLKECPLPLKDWANILSTDTSKASRILSGLVNKHIFARTFHGPGRGYSYTMNTRVAEWDNSCLNRQQLSEMARQGLPKTTTVVLPKTTTPPDTNLASRKEILNKVKEKSSNNNIKQQTTKEETNQTNQLSKEMAEIATLYEVEIGKITPFVAQELNDAVKEYPADQIKEAIKIAVEQNIRKWSYIQGILRKWKEGLGTVKKEDPDKYIKGKYGHMVRR